MKVVVIGCGIIGSAIAFHLTRSGMAVEVWEEQITPGLGATGAALGILLAVSSAARGRIDRLRLASLHLYDQWLPTLGDGVLLHQGIFCIPQNREDWAELLERRREQGYILSPGRLGQWEGFFSSADRVVHPRNLLSALIGQATAGGAKFHWGRKLLPGETPIADRVVISAGLGTRELAGLPLQPVGGQGILIRAESIDPPLPAVHIRDEVGDVNIVPLLQGKYWIGATVEFDPTVLPRAENVASLLHRVGNYFPQFHQSEVLDTWANYRPRPIGRSAPVIEHLPDRPHWIVASGHYRNGILLAPITAQLVKEMILAV